VANRRLTKKYSFDRLSEAGRAYRPPPLAPTRAPRLRRVVEAARSHPTGHSAVAVPGDIQSSHLVNSALRSNVLARGCICHRQRGVLCLSDSASDVQSEGPSGIPFSRGAVYHPLPSRNVESDVHLGPSFAVRVGVLCSFSVWRAGSLSQL